MESSYTEQVTAIIGLNNFGQYVMAMIIMAFLPALCEETLFRGGLQNFLTRSTNKPLLSIIIVSIIFSAVHFSWYGFLPRFFLGFVLGFIYHYSGKIWLNIIAHFLNNALAITAFYIDKMQGKPLKDLVADNGSSWLGIIALPIAIGLLLFFKRISYRPALMTNKSIDDLFT
jgi:membrane protease YdiL (CAAX protease family)